VSKMKKLIAIKNLAKELDEAIDRFANQDNSSIKIMYDRSNPVTQAIEALQFTLPRTFSAIDNYMETRHAVHRRTRQRETSTS
jgi:hypothetical protein